MFAKSLVGMVHVPALPGAPRSRLSVDQIVDQAANEADQLACAGFDALIIENMHDVPYLHAGADAGHGSEVTAVMTRVALAVREIAPDKPLGIQVLSGGNREALAIALASGASFIRCENFVFAHVGDEGLMATAEAGPLLRYRRSIGAEEIAIYADVKKKHASHAITADLSIGECVEAAEFFGASGVVVTGSATGKPVDQPDLAAAREATRLPVLVGSGVTPETTRELFAFADALIVGSFIKRGGHWSNEIDPRRCEQMVAAAKAAREQLAPRRPQKRPRQRRV
jgi:uncharacterized protein